MPQMYATFQRGLIKGLCVPELESHLDFFAKGFEEWLAVQPLRVFLERPNRVVSLRLPPTVLTPASSSEGAIGSSVVVKQFGWRSPLHRILRPLAGSKAIRAFRIAIRLREAGVSTPRPLIAWDRRDRGTRSASYCITEEIPDAATLRELRRSPSAFESERVTLLPDLARLLREMHDAGILHRDLTIGNFLVSPKPIEGHRLFLIDLSRAVNPGRLPLLLRFPDLARMKLLELWPDFYKAYCAGHPEWESFWPILNVLIRLRRWKMDYWKKIKGR
jgi:Lipopolysaccharide kinase (Kdo/WaaP) family